MATNSPLQLKTPISRSSHSTRLCSPGGSSWAKKYEPSVQDFVDYFYGAQARKTITDQLATQGQAPRSMVIACCDRLSESVRI